MRSRQNRVVYSSMRPCLVSISSPGPYSHSSAHSCEFRQAHPVGSALPHRGIIVHVPYANWYWDYEALEEQG